MQAVTSKESAARRKAATVSASADELSMYNTPPQEEVTLEDFEQFAIDRLRVLKAIEDAQSRGKKPEEMKALIADKLHEHRLDTRHGDEGEWARRDQVSHFVLRLAYCRSEELRRWLLTQECALFRHRFGELLPAAKAAFLTAHGLHYAPLTAAQFEAPDGAGVPLRQHLRTVLEQTVGVRREAAASLVAEGASSFYGVPFTDVPELVRGRRAFLRGGIAYVHREALAPLVVGAFRASLSRALAVTHRKWAARFGAEEEDRLAPIVASLSTRYLGARYGAPGGGGADGGAAVSLAELDAAAAASFPLCMRNLYGHLKDSHHLKHAGRMQLGLFLKGIGLSLEDAMAFWKTEFCKRIPGDAFEKQYAYNIRHTYGREGKRADLSAFSCMKVIMSTPGTGEHHGCPFRSFGEDSLRAALRQMKVSGPAVADVLEKVKGQHYQLACGSAFAATHGGCECDAGIQHPNQYFSASRKLLATPATLSTPPGPAKAIEASYPGVTPPSAPR